MKIFLCLLLKFIQEKKKKSANGLKAMHVGVRRVRVRSSERFASWQIDVEGWAQVISTND